VRLVEVRLLDGPNVYRLEPTVKIEVAVGRRRTWYGDRMPGRYGVVRLGAPVSPRRAPPPIRDIATWVRQLHSLTSADAWIRKEHGVEDGAVEGTSARTANARRSLSVTIHRTSEPGHWIVAFPWRERGRAEAIAEGAWRLAERGVDPRAAPGGRSRDMQSSAPTQSRRRVFRTVGGMLDRIREANTDPPEWIRDGERRMPVVSITGTNGKSTTTRMISQILRTAGRHVGTTTSDGVLIDGELVEPGDYTGPSGAKHVFDRPEVEVAVLETARGGILLRGVGYESNEASVITNVSSDHLDLLGLHTLPELAEVKAVTARITKRDGTVVLNADDPLVAAVGARVRAPVCYFSLRPGSARVRRHVAAGGQAMVLDDGWLVELRGSRRERLMPAADAPATLLGLARHNVANALAAAAAARAMGLAPDAVAAGLRAFRPTAEQAPGRVNLYRMGDRLVIIDFAHNEAGIRVVLDLAEAICGPRARRRRSLTVIVGAAGDRPDDTLRGIGRAAAQRADRLAIKETRKYLRGRSPESVIGEILAGMVQGGARRSRVPIYEDEKAALRAMATDSTAGAQADSRERAGRTTSARSSRPAATGPAESGGKSGEVIVLAVHEDRAGVRATLDDLGAAPIEAADLAELVTIRDRAAVR
jgi:cyanophycin synthetase